MSFQANISQKFSRTLVTSARRVIKFLFIGRDKIKSVGFLAKTEQTPRKLLYLMNRHDANTLGDTGFFRRYQGIVKAIVSRVIEDLKYFPNLLVT